MAPRSWAATAGVIGATRVARNVRYASVASDPCPSSQQLRTATTRPRTSSRRSRSAGGRWDEAAAPGRPDCIIWSISRRTSRPFSSGRPAATLGHGRPAAPAAARRAGAAGSRVSSAGVQQARRATGSRRHTTRAAPPSLCPPLVVAARERCGRTADTRPPSPREPETSLFTLAQKQNGHLIRNKYLSNNKHHAAPQYATTGPTHPTNCMMRINIIMSARVEAARRWGARCDVGYTPVQVHKE
eukprot:scaffold12910_cov102-Isochrysis_galbana.AAC.2